MKLNKIHQELKELYKGKITETILGVEFEYKKEKERSMNLFRSGYWSVAPFAFEDYNDFAVKLTPNKELLSSPVVVRSISDFIVFSDKLINFLPFRQLAMLRNPKFINYILEDWQLLEEISLPLREYTGGLNILDYLNIYLHDKDKLKYIDGSEKNYTQVYLDFWNHYYDTQEQEAFVKLMQDLVDESSYLPDFEVKDYGVSSERVYNALTQRAYSYSLDDLEEEKKAAFYWKSFIQSHGFDAESYITEILPATSTSSNSQIESTIGYANPDRIYQFPKEMQEHPLFKALEQIIKSTSSYNGQAHLEAAKRIDEELGDPIMAWNALVSAGYWSGLNYNEPNIEAWNAAITLSEKHGWTEINEVLKDQLAFYNHYKDEL